MIEILVVMTIIGVVTMLGAPSLAAFIDDMRLTSATNDLLSFFNYSRSEAAKRSARVTMCISSDLSTCSTGSVDWAEGAVAFVDTDGNGQVNGAEVVLRVMNPTTNVRITATTAFASTYSFYYRPSGAASSPGTLQVCRSGRKARDVSVNAVGRPMSQLTTTTC